MNETKDDLISVLNYCIIVAKKYITSCKLQNKDCTLNRFLEKLQQRLMVEKYIATVNNRLERYILKWSFVIDAL